MSNSETAGHPPIYERLIHERGDAPAEARQAAQQVQRRANEALDWSDLRASQKKREEGFFSAFD
ncbi:hypothetical protein [Streptomyces sp. H39-S7]|uniref:hypothetical protein n=1 Tax=Streptomyces sp. H39-S7 TaxID=3004357 RepID=UPI0022AE6CE2|nr:hypothetical protein [Streptomyces sp. H39-S7]MCZ4119968.1 hypothetical protein [Streptomyces sp. H39-S7]